MATKRLLLVYCIIVLHMAALATRVPSHCLHHHHHHHHHHHRPLHSVVNRLKGGSSTASFALNTQNCQSKLRNNFEKSSPFSTSLSSRRLSPNTSSFFTAEALHVFGARNRNYHHHRRRQIGNTFALTTRMTSSKQNDNGVVTGIEYQRSLSEMLATRLVRGRISSSNSNNNDDNDKDESAIRACIAIAGGGSYATSSILSIPGASSVLLESVVVYDRKSFGEYLSCNTNDDDRWLKDMDDQVVAQWKGGAMENDDDVSFATSDADIDKNIKRSFKFCSIEAAMLLSHSALRRSVNLSSNFADRCLRSTGVGCTSSLVAGPGEGRKGRKSRAYVACSTLSSGTWVWELELDCEDDIRRSRLEEELVVSNVVLLAMIRCRENRQSIETPVDKIDDEIGSILRKILNHEGDSFTEKRLHPHNFNTYLSREGSRAVASGASQIVDGLADIVAVLPIIGYQAKAVRMQPLLSDCDIPIPRDVLILPGSYNPPHVGHVGLANAAVLALKRLRRKEQSERENSMSSAILQSLWDTVDEHIDGHCDPTVLFEMSVTNVDKPPLNPMEVLRRVDLFASLSLSSIDMPKDWAIILTNAPLFSQKTDILDRLIVSDETRNELRGGRRRMSFVIGTDTMVRIINPKYYGDIRDDMISALLRMKERGVHFIVGGRVESSIFVNGEEQVMSLPMEIQEMFTFLTEDEFRLDISSTELRERLGK